MVLNPDGRMVGTVGLDDIAVISTEDALLVVNMKRLEEMPSVMQELFAQLRQKNEGKYL